MRQMRKWRVTFCRWHTQERRKVAETRIVEARYLCVCDKSGSSVFFTNDLTDSEELIATCYFNDVSSVELVDEEENEN